jgi:hypothetical protein
MRVAPVSRLRPRLKPVRVTPLQAAVAESAGGRARQATRGPQSLAGFDLLGATPARLHGFRAITAPFAPAASNQTVPMSWKPRSSSQAPYSLGV